MQVQKVSRLLNNKTLLKGLEKISEHGASFAAGTSLVMSLGVRPLAIFSTPDVEKENKQYAATNSICSGLIKFAMVEAVALPVENVVKKIDVNYSKYLKPETVQVLKGNSSSLIKSKSYKLTAQMIKLGTGLITAIPKSVLTIALIPVVMDKLFKSKRKQENYAIEQGASKHKVIQTKNIPFEGRANDILAKGISKIFDNKLVQNFAIKHADEEKNIAKHMSAGTDILLTASGAYQTYRSPKIKENRKKALIYYNTISTAATLLFGYGIDSIAKRKSGKFIKAFSEANRHDPKLHKYIEGINILRPALIFAGIYYGLLPVFSTYIAEKVDKYISKTNLKTKEAEHLQTVS